MTKVNSVLKYAAFAGLLVSCTDLNVKERDSLVVATESGGFTGVNPAATVKSATNDLGQWADQANIYALNEVSSDEIFVPTRGTDWGDNGVWRTLAQHAWDGNHQFVLNVWNNLNGNIFKLNQMLDPRSNANPLQTAQAKFLRAYNMWYLVDLFRQVPQRGINDGPNVNPTVLSVQDAVDQIIKDLNEAIPGLPSLGPTGVNDGSCPRKDPVISEAAGNFLKAKVLLNKHIYLGGTPSPADMNAVIAAVDAITADGFALQSGNYFNIFTAEADSETILWAASGVGNRIWNGLHYNQVAPDQNGGWNGFSTYADFYAKFEGSQNSNEPGNNQEPRRGFVPTSGSTLQGFGPTNGSNLGIGFGFLVGQQYAPSGAKLKDRAGNDLVFTKDFPGIVANSERTGTRVLKYHPSYKDPCNEDDAGNVKPNNSFVSHYILFRYADAHLMKAEAALRGGTSSTPAQTLIDQLRNIRGATSPLSATLDNLYDERGRELYAEGWRRNDMVRFGKFNAAFGFVTNTDNSRSVYPIPTVALTSNPNLKQNPGY